MNILLQAVSKTRNETRNEKKMVNGSPAHFLRMVVKACPHYKTVCTRLQ